MIDVLSHLVSRAVNNALVKAIVGGGEHVVVSHLQFADDTTFFFF